MKKLLYVLLLSLVTFIITGCEDCDHESDYDLVGVKIEDFAIRSKIKITQHLCHTDNITNDNYSAGLNNPSIYGKKQGFYVANKLDNKTFDLQKTIHQLFPMEAYKDDKYEQCNDYFIYDFFSQYHRSERPLYIDNITVNGSNPDVWCVTIGGEKYGWDLTNSPYKITK